MWRLRLILCLWAIGVIGLVGCTVGDEDADLYPTIDPTLVYESQCRAVETNAAGTPVPADCLINPAEATALPTVSLFGTAVPANMFPAPTTTATPTPTPTP